MFLLQSVAGKSRLKCGHVLRALAYFSLAITTIYLPLKGHYIVEQMRPQLGLNIVASSAYIIFPLLLVGFSLVISFKNKKLASNMRHL